MKPTKKNELILLGKDLLNAKILVLDKHRFSAKEISELTGVPESVVRNLIHNFKEN